MNKDTAKEYLPLVQALAEGKIIQTQYNGIWVDNPSGVSFFNAPECYRIKPEPIKKWYKIALLSCGTHCGPYCADTEQQEYQFEQHFGFIKWLTPRVEYIVEE